MKKVLTLLTLAALSHVGFGQITSRLYSSGEELKSMQSRTLVVEMLDEGSEPFRKLQASSDVPESAKSQLLSEFEKYNEAMKAAVQKYWTLHPTERIEFVPSSKLVDKKGRDYVFMEYRELGDNSSIGSYKFKGDEWSRSRYGYLVPALMYHRAERNADEPDYIGYLPLIGRDEGDQYSVTDLGFTLANMQRGMEASFDSKKPVKYHKYIYEAGQEDCGQLADKTMLIDPYLLSEKVDKETIAKRYDADVEYISAETYKNISATGTSDQAVLINVVCGALETGAGPFEKASLFSLKAVVDPTDMSIIACSNYLILKAGEKDFKILAKCL